jgi:tetratricopeptide (TPR) repeat protein
MDGTPTIAEYTGLLNRAEALLHAGRIPEALNTYFDGLRLYIARLKEQPNTRFTLNEFNMVDRLADLTMLSGQNQAAAILLSALSDQARLAANNWMRVHAVTKLFFVHLTQGETDDAILDIRSLKDVTGDIEKMRFSESGLAEWENGIRYGSVRGPQDRQDQLVCLYDALSALLFALGRYSEGVLLLRRGIDNAEKNRSPLVDSRLLPMKLALAKACFEKGDLAKATAVFAEALPAAENAEIATGIPFQCLELKSKMALAQGRMGEAYDDLQKIIALCRGHGLPLAGINARFNLAKVKVLLNQVKDAGDLLQECLEDAEKAREKNLASRIRRYLEIADRRVRASIPALNYASNRTPGSITTETTTSNRPEETGAIARSADYLNNFDEKALMLQLYLSDDRPDKAFEILSQLKVQVAGCDSVLIHVRLRMLELTCLQFTNADIPANYPFADALDFLSSNQLLPELWQFRQLLAHTQLIPGENKGAWTAENQQLLDRITTSLSPSMQTLYLLNKWSANEEYLSGCANDLLRLKNGMQGARPLPLRWKRKWKLMKALHSFQEDANRYKDYLTRTICQGEQPGKFGFPTKKGGVLAKLWRQPRGTLTICYLVLPDRIVIVARSFLRISYYVTFMSRVILRQLVFDLRDRLYPKGISRDFLLAGKKPDETIDNTEELSQQLAEILQLGTIMREYGKDVRHLSIVPDDVLNGLPFSLLSVNGTRLPVTTRVSISIDDRPSTPEQLHFPGKMALLVGVSKGIPGMEDLPAVPEEIGRISEELWQYGATVQLEENEKATPEVIKQYLRSAQIAHFSCHGKFDYRQPDQSGLLLAGGEMLTLKDILSMGDLANMRLAVLSSCRGAEHFILPGRWIIGLPETLCRAGVEAVLGFLWPVNDDFATAFTTQFYGYLKDNVPAEAFRLTILDAINKTLSGLTVEYWKPRFWAGAILYQR